VQSLDEVDLTCELSKREGKRQLKAAQKRLHALRLQAGGQLGGGELGPPLCVVCEGWDASGKGGAIRRMTTKLDPRHFTVAAFAAPSEREKRHHFLWRFWPVLPGWGGMTVLDRSWYGRVLVERVEGFATEAEWQRAYAEIVEFERSLCAEGAVLVKLWFHVTEDEQRRRFAAREDDPLKSWKLTDEDWRNLSKRPAYEAAVREMLERTDHPDAPWRLIAGEDKRYARVAALQAVIEALETGLRRVGRAPVEADG
jgi:polyphosphate kinase 2 (PPK2 family)